MQQLSSIFEPIKLGNTLLFFRNTSTGIDRSFFIFLLQFDNIFFSVLYEQKREFKRENLNKVHLQIKEFFDYDKNLQLL